MTLNGITYTHLVKCREKNQKRWAFITPDGGINYLKIHAAMFVQEQAEELIRVVMADPENKNFEFKMVLIK